MGRCVRALQLWNYLAFGAEERKGHSGGIRVEFSVKGFSSESTGSLSEMGFFQQLTFLAVDFPA